MIQMHTKSAGRRGFTLMELMVVMLIAVFSVTAFYAGFKFFSISMKRAFLNTMVTKELHKALENITRDLSWAECLATDDSNLHKKNAPDVLAFKIPGITANGDPVDNCYDYIYVYAKPNGDYKDLYYAVIPNVEGSGSLREQITLDSKKIAGNISNIEFTSDGTTPISDDGSLSVKNDLKALYALHIRITYRILNVKGELEDCNLFGYVKLRNHPHYLI